MMMTYHSKQLLEKLKDYEWRKSVDRIEDFKALFKDNNTIEMMVHGFPNVKYTIVTDGYNCIYQKYYRKAGKFVMGTGKIDKSVFRFEEEHRHVICALYESVITNSAKLAEEVREEARLDYFKGDQLSLF